MRVDHRAIYLAFIVLITIPLLVPLNLPIPVSKNVQDAFNAISSVPAGGIILVGCDFRAFSWSEIGGGATDVLRQLFNLPVKLVLVSLIPEGPIMCLRALGAIDTSKKTYGVDWVQIGYISGREAAASGLATNFKSLAKNDVHGTLLSGMTIMQNVNVAKDFSLILTFEDENSPWLLYWTVPYGVAIVETGQALLIPNWLPYYNAKQLKGYVGGIRQYAEYDRTLGVAGEPSKFMDAVNVSFLYLILMMVMANVVFWQGRMKEGGKR